MNASDGEIINFVDNEFYKCIEPQNMQPLVLAQIGDSVHSLYVRTNLALRFNVKVNKLSKMVSSVVCAGNQFLTFKAIENELFDEEKEIANRARNSNIHSKAKNFSVTEYIYATALEALFGYLYLTKNTERLNKFLKISVDLVFN